MDLTSKDIARGRKYSGLWITLIVVGVILLDQILKIYIKTHYYMGEDHEVTSWFHLKFIENNGMAFGLELWSKLVLTFGRICAVAVFIWFMSKIKNLTGIRNGLFVSLALITAGAAGNIFDCVFYGEIFNNPMPPETAVLFPTGGGYSTWFEGRVVDMLYFPFFSFCWPEWVPFIGGGEFEFFQYIFNVADASICVGVALLIFFYSKDISLALDHVTGGRFSNKNDAEGIGKETKDR